MGIRRQLFVGARTALVTSAGLFTLQIWYSSYLDVAVVHGDLGNVPVDTKLAAVRNEERAKLTSGPMPLDQAMKALAQRGRDAFPQLEAKPSGDLSAMSGWVHKPGFKPYVPRPVPSPAAEATALATGADVPGGERAERRGALGAEELSVMSDQRRWIAPLAGVAIGVGVFAGVNVATGRAIVPTVASVSGTTMVATVDLALQPGAPAAPTGTYQVACGVCHQPEGQGIPFAFPPLAGSDWMTGDPETPIRIVLLGLGGAIDVNGSSFNLVMPPPPTLDDAKIAEAITYARTNFGNNASAVDAEMVKKVRDSLGGRTAPWTAAELTALRRANTSPPLTSAGEPHRAHSFSGKIDAAGSRPGARVDDRDGM